MKYSSSVRFYLSLAILLGLYGSGCSSDKNINQAKLTGTQYWTNKAHPGKAFDVQVTEAVKVDGGKYRVKALVDGEQRVGTYDPNTETFDEGYYSTAYERGKKIAEQDEEIRYLKDQVDKLEKENYQLKLRLKYVQAGHGDPNLKVNPDVSVDEGVSEIKPSKKGKEVMPVKEVSE